MRRCLAILAAATAAIGAGCAPAPKPPPRAAQILVEEEESWRKAASPADASAIDAVPALRARLVASARSRFGRRLAAERELLEADAGLPRAAPAPGPYRCRFVRLGQPSSLATSRPAFCYVGVEGDRLSLSTETAGLRLGGYLWEEEGGRRLIFLGAAVPPRAKVPPAYGETPERDSAGIFERTGDFRYRLTVPGRGSPEHLHVVELVAAPQEG